MVRLMLVLAPVMCVLSGIGASCCLEVFMSNVRASEAAGSSSSLMASLGFDKLWQALVGGAQAAGDADEDAKQQEAASGAKAAGLNKQKQKQKKRIESLYPYKGEVCRTAAAFLYTVQYLIFFLFT